jgi:predicted secreted hydrolase
VTATGEWRSPGTETVYPSGWTLEIADAELVIRVTPSLPDQELDTRPTTGVIYWEGEALVEAADRGESLGGHAYVELTGYAPYEPLDLTTPLATTAG